MKACLIVIIEKVLENIIIMTDQFMKEHFIRIKGMVREYLYIMMVLYIMVCSYVMKNMDLEN
jgi:hypothetical protein